MKQGSTTIGHQYFPNFTRCTRLAYLSGTIRDWHTSHEQRRELKKAEVFLGRANKAEETED
ncbi:hypothetical protein TRAPUB_13964 [Trametes pubescens]|uniref:Uncharacterized protein n=1 Tax=Trametes pubescens TaxID=154538 RepID=A0A1M2VPR9_TRAPU|nr:hypothetical protein TRAPUB_13964 [Trametes pubescens]